MNSLNVEEYYSDKRDEFKVHYIFLRCHDEHTNADLVLCTESGYCPFILIDLVNAMNAKEVTGHDLFDEFWFYWWDESCKINI